MGATYVVAYLIFLGLGWSRIRSVKHAACWGVTMALGGILAWLLVGGLILYAGRAMPVTTRMWRMLIEMHFAIILAVNGLVAAGVWLAHQGWFRMRGHRILLQNGRLCPRCAYDLAGNTSMVCPECGTPFSFELLDTTRKEFERLVQRRSPRPVGSDASDRR
jgi:hypothetical protein